MPLAPNALQPQNPKDLDPETARGRVVQDLKMLLIEATHGEKGGEWLRVRPKPSRFRHDPSRVGLRAIQCAMAGQE